MPAAKKPTVKKTVKPAVKAEKKAVVKKPVSAKKETPVKVEGTLTVSLFDNTGKAKGTVKLPEAVFGTKVNDVLMAQAVRVYLANQRMGAAVTQTRGEVDGSTRKIYRQKGTGRARHGGIRAPIFVGGGTAHGPKSRDYSLDMSQSMRKAATRSALSAMTKEGHVVVVGGLGDLAAKTKLVAAVLAGMSLNGKKALLVLPEYKESIVKASRNIDRLTVVTTQLLNTYAVLNAGTVVLMQEAVGALEKQFGKVEKVSPDKKKESK